jgi:hypothetical protein
MSKHNGFVHTSLNIDPFRFMELDKPDIFYKLTSELGYPEEEAHGEFHSMLAMLTRLKSMRCCQSQTDDYLKDAVPDLHPRVKIAAVTILLNATNGDDTYCHAYNTFVYYSNRYMGLNLPRKIISNHQLLMLLEAEKRQAENPGAGQNKLTLQQIALKYAWEGKLITKQNMNEIARQSGYNSGDALYNHYCRLSMKSDRLADPESLMKLKNKIKLFEKVIEFIPEANKQRALNELTVLQEILEKTYL